MKEELFVPIDGCPGFFISNYGRVRKGIAKIVKTIVANKGYVVLQVRMGGMAKRFSVHRLVAKHFIGDIEGRQINHKDFNKANNYFENLEIVSGAENMRHFHSSGRAKDTYKKISSAKTGIKRGSVIVRKISTIEQGMALQEMSRRQSTQTLANLRALVEKHGVTHQQLADRIVNETTGAPIRRQSVTGMLNRKFCPTLDSVFQMLNALNEIAGTRYGLKDI